jgi:hypothetical protein
LRSALGRRLVSAFIAQPSPLQGIRRDQRQCTGHCCPLSGKLAEDRPSGVSEVSSLPGRYIRLPQFLLEGGDGSCGKLSIVVDVAIGAEEAEKARRIPATAVVRRKIRGRRAVSWRSARVLLDCARLKGLLCRPADGGPAIGSANSRSPRGLAFAGCGGGNLVSFR